MTRTPLLVAVGVITLAMSACGAADDGAATTKGVAQLESTSISDPQNLTAVSASYGVGATSLADLRQRADAIVIGTVVSTVDGPDASVKDPSVHDRQLRRDVTVRIDEVISGDSPKTISLRTFGWELDSDERRTPIVGDGEPWLDEGEVVFFALKDFGDEWAPLGAQGAFEVKDGKLAERPFESGGPVEKALIGLTVDEAAAKVTAAKE